MFPISRGLGIALGLLALGGPSFDRSRAIDVVNPHVTNGQFDPNEWTGPLATGVASPDYPFNPSDNTGGAWLYAEQVTTGPFNTLYLMHDYTSSPDAGGLTAANSYFDVFFQVPSQDRDYVVRMFQNPDTSFGFRAVEKLSGVVSPLSNDGSFNIDDTNVWTPLSQEDLDAAQFVVALGTNTTSPNSACPT